MIKRLIILFLTITYFASAQNYGTLSFTNYADDRKAAFSLTFDDGLLTHSTNVKPLLNQYGFKGTFYVLPPYLAEDNQPLIWRYGRWSDFQMIAADGHEVGSHTMNHDTLPNLDWGNINSPGTLLYELYQSKLFIEQKIPSQKCISLNYPYTLHNSLVDSAAKLFYENGRTLGQTANDSVLFGNDWFSLKAKVVEFSMPRDSVDDDLGELYSFINWLGNAVTKKQWGMIIIHDVVPFNELQSLINNGIYEPVTNEWLGWLCDWLEVKSLNKEIWVETVGNITRYIKEREAAAYQILTSNNQLIEINVTDNLDNEIYNYPLTAYVKIPESWHYVRVQQNTRIDTLPTLLDNSVRKVLLNVIPDKGLLNITPVTPTDISTEDIPLNDFILFQNYPNPFNPETNIRYSLGSREFVSLKVYDVLGKEVAVLVSEYQDAGLHTVNFNTDQYNLSSGIYLYRLQSGGESYGSGSNFSQTKKMIYLR